jgi:hypothetical protein
MDILAERRPAASRARGGRLMAAAVAVVAVTVAMLAACSGASTPGPAPQKASPDGAGRVSAPPRGGPAWLLTRWALSRLLADPAAREVLRGSQVYEILRPGQKPLAGTTAKLIVIFASARALEDAVTGGTLPAGTYGLLYDPEAWSFTPLTERREPVRAATQAAAVAHAHGLRLIVAPALDLTTVLAPGSQGPRWHAFLDLGLIGHLARVADVVELQAQSLERDTATYSAFLRAATSQASQANPRITVLAGLSTNPPGAPVDSQHLTSAIQATRSMVDGYWLNIPGQGARCPTCNAARPDIAIQTLQALR